MRRSAFTEYVGLALVVVALVAGFGLATEYFLTATTFRTIANQMPDILLVSTGMTLVIISGGIDLSVGSVLALSGAVLGVALADWHWPTGAGVALAVTVGAACGAANGLLVTRWSLPSFIVTLGMLEIARGAAYLVTASQTKYIGGAIETLAAPVAAGLSLPFFGAVLLVVAGQLLLGRTVYGRHLIAVGANESAAWLSGVKPGPVRFVAFTVAGLLSGLAAVAQCARLAAAVVIGGTTLAGGRGSVVTTMLGVIVIAILGAGLAQLGVQEPTRRLVTGAVIIAASIVDYYRTRVSA